jgi:hypothetical protein
MKLWGTNNFGPSVFRTEGRYLSRAELFQVLTDALAEFDRTGKLPQTVRVHEVYGPIRVLTGHGPNEGEVSVAALAKICVGLSTALHEKHGDGAPITLPIGIPVSGETLNPAQLLRLMAFAVLNPSPEAKLNIRMAYEFAEMDELIPKSRPLGDDGFAWTLKPAPLEGALQSNASR